MDTLKGFDYEVVHIGGHDYLAVSKEQVASAKRKLRRAMSRRFGNDDSILTLVFVGLILAAALVFGVLLWRRRYA